MRRLVGVLVLLVLCIAMAGPQAAAAPAMSSEEWFWFEAATLRVDAGDTLGAVDYWRKLVDSLKSHNPTACGNYAQNLGRALDSLGLYDEAVAAFEEEFACWGQFPDRAEWMAWDQRRVEQIRPEIRTFVARPTEGESPGTLAKHEPAFGTVLGGVIDNDEAVRNDVSKVPAAYGKGYGIVLVYARWGETIPIVSTASAKKAGAALQVGWEPTNGLDAVKDDSYVRGFARKLKDYGLPVYLRYASEMNGSWTPWHGDPAKYKEKFALIARIMREEAPNVAMVWAPGFIGDQPWADYYPGDAAVDWVGVNLYHEKYFLSDPSSSQMLNDLYYAGRSNPLDKLKEIYNTYSQRKPIMIAETGIAWATRKPYQEDTAWAVNTLQRVYGYLPLIYPRIKAVSYFQVDFKKHPQVPSSGHYVISGNPDMTQAYRLATASGWYLESAKATAPQLWRPAEQATLSGQTRVASYVNLADGVSRVDYALDGKVIATATQLPWVADIDLSGLSGAHELTVRAYDQKGALGTERRYGVNASAIKVDLNGRTLDFDQPPVNLDGTTMVPARVIFEALGATVGWESSTRTLVAQRGDSVLRLSIDNPVATKDGKPMTEMRKPAAIIGGRTLVPARFVAEAFNLDVTWNGGTATVVIKPKQ